MTCRQLVRTHCERRIDLYSKGMMLQSLDGDLHACGLGSESGATASLQDQPLAHRRAKSGASATTLPSSDRRKRRLTQETERRTSVGSPATHRHSHRRDDDRRWNDWINRRRWLRGSSLQRHPKPVNEMRNDSLFSRRLSPVILVPRFVSRDLLRRHGASLSRWCQCLSYKALPS